MHRFTLRSLAAGIALLPASCGGPDAALAPESTATVGEFGGGFEAHGTEPAWRVEVKDGVMSVTAAGLTDYTDRAAFTLVAGKAAWAMPIGEWGARLVVSKGECSEGDSDVRYAYSATLFIKTTEMKGCAFPLGADPRGPS